MRLPVTVDPVPDERRGDDTGDPQLTEATPVAAEHALLLVTANYV